VHSLMKKILLSTYIIKVLDNRNNEQILSRFNGSHDFLKFFEKYLNEIFLQIKNVSDISGTNLLHLTLESPPNYDLINRRIFGYFHAGISGDQYQIRDLDTLHDLLNVETSHVALRKLFFYIQLPNGKKSGALVLQRKAKFGIKTILSKTINTYMKEQGYQLYHVEINNILHERVYEKMIEQGNLRKIQLIKKRIPSTIEEYYSNGQEPNEIPGKLTTTMSSSTSLPESYRKFVNFFYRRDNMTRIEIKDIDQEFDEIEFELELNGKKKTFYIANKNRIQPDIDVTSEIEFDKEGNPTINSFLSQCEELVRDVIEIQPPNV